MKTRTQFRRAALQAATFAIASMVAVGQDGASLGGALVSEAQAIVGRPATPVSVAGVARRTTRRTIRRTAVYVSTLPPNCTTVNVNGVALRQCGTTYYQPSGNQYVVVEVD